MQPALDPARTDVVADALLGHLRERLGDDSLAFAEAPTPLGRGFASFIYAFRLEGDGLPDGWRAPLVLRVLPDAGAGPVVEREAVVQRFVTGRGYPALVPLVAECGVDAIGLPFVVMTRVPGVTMLERITRNPLSAWRLLDSMADLHVRLHRLPVEGCTLPYEQPSVERVLVDLRRRLGRAGAAGMAPGLRWLEEHRTLALNEEVVVCHNDFHPLNIMVGDAGLMTVLDWTDASLGDRHSDVARTVTILWFAEIAGRTVLERFVLRSVRRFLRGGYLTPYRRQFPIEQQRFRYWEALHGFQGWLQLAELAARGTDAPESQLETVQRIPPGVTAKAERYFKRKCERV